MSEVEQLIHLREQARIAGDVKLYRKLKDKLYRVNNRERLNALKRQHRRDNKEAHAVIYKRRYQKHKEVLLENGRKRYEKKKLEIKKKRDSIREELRVKSKIHYSENKSMYISRNAKRRAAEIQATPIWAELDKIKVLYDKVAWLESLTGLKYHVDHVVPLNSKKVCGLHVWANLQILEVGVNLSKSNKVGGL